MKRRLWVVIGLMVVGIVAAVVLPCIQPIKVAAGFSGYRVIEPIRQGNLTIFPVVAAASHNTQAFLTLDEGLRSGDVVVTESGNLSSLVRPRHPGEVQSTHVVHGGAEVNRLVLVNNSKRPLILLAGEIVTGGKQDRVIGKDRLVPAESDPIDVSVFCVEPGRWTGAKQTFGSPEYLMAQPNVRRSAMADKNQQQVWNQVAKAREFAIAAAPPGPPPLAGSSSYARVMQDGDVKQKVNAMAVPIQKGYENVIKQLRDRSAVGVVVAVNGEIVWADIFASTALLEKYWPKLVRSYAAEAVYGQTSDRKVDMKAGQAFVDALEGRHETVESEPGLYSHTEINGDGFKVFELTSLLPKTGFDLHLAKMAD